MTTVELAAQPAGVPRLPFRTRLFRGIHRMFAIVLFGLPVLVIAWGLPYYTAPLAERVRHPAHRVLNPAGDIGQAFGVLAFALFLFLWLYPLRKRVGRAPWLGPVRGWLDVHIVAGLAVPLIGAVHATFRFQGVVGLGYAAMLVVALSGIVGRYLYVRIPRGVSGLAASREEIARLRDAMLAELAGRTGMSADELSRALMVSEPAPPRLGIVATFTRLIRDDLRRRRAARRLVREWRRSGAGSRAERDAARSVLRLARRQMALAQQIRMLEATQRVFGYWHAAHLPVAITAMIAVLIHVAVVVSLGVTWFY
ncbi:MAG: hypothetical protein Kow0062_16790 [Acidobacteriota bacterium]